MLLHATGHASKKSGKKDKEDATQAFQILVLPERSEYVLQKRITYLISTTLNWERGKPYFTIYKYHKASVPPC